MKKILTFLVMLFVTVSVAVAQEPISEPTNGQGTEVDVLPEAQPIYFNYQAVVRDITNANALYHDKDNLKVTIEIFDAQHAEAAIYTEVHENVPTNHNGMVSLLVGKGQHNADADMLNVDWRTAWISSTFEVEGNVISLVQTPITAVPLALQSQGPMMLTTQQIVNYILDPEKTDHEDVDAILNAISANPYGLKDYLKTTFYNYLKNHKSEAKELVLYFLDLVDPEDLEEAEEHLTPATKQKIIDMLVQYAKDNRDAAKKILKYYLQTTSVAEVEEIYNEIPQSIKDWSVQKVIDYVKAHPELAEEVAKAYYDGAQVSDVNKIYNYLSQHNTEVYARLIAIFDNHLLNYLNAHHYLTGVCPDKEGSPFQFCDIVERVVSLENAINENISCEHAVIQGVTAVRYVSNGYIEVQVTLDKALATGESLSVAAGGDDFASSGVTGNVYKFTYGGYNPDAAPTTVSVSIKVNNEPIQGTTKCTYQKEATISVVD